MQVPIGETVQRFSCSMSANMTLSHVQSPSTSKQRQESCTYHENEEDVPVLLQSFGHQVSGRAGILCYNNNTICKPYVSRELFFYHYFPTVLRKFIPQFRGLINVTFLENVQSGSILIYAQPKTRIAPHSSALKKFVEIPKPHSKRCVKDYGRTHVIYPCSPVLAPLRAKTVANGSLVIEEDVEILTRGFDENVSLHSDDAPLHNHNVVCKSSTGQHNPWNSKVIDDACIKLKTNLSEMKDIEHMTTTAKTKRFILLENIAAPYRRPCVLDLKMGTRVRENASSAKLARHVTAIDIGARLSGMQIYLPKRKEFEYMNKYYGHNLTVNGFKANLVHFFSRGISLTNRPQQYEQTTDHHDRVLSTNSDVDVSLVKCAIAKLRLLRESLSTLCAYRFYSGSVLILYEGDYVCDYSAPSGDAGMNAKLSSKKSQNNGRLASSHLTKNETHHQQQIHFKARAKSDRPNSLPVAVDKKGSKSDVSSPEFYHSMARLVRKIDQITNPTETISSKAMRMCNEQITFSDPNEAIDHPVVKGKEKRHVLQKNSGTRRQKLSKSCSSLHNHQAQDRFDDFDQTKVKDFTEQLDVRVIDFAHYCFQDQDVHPGPDGGFLFGLDNVIDLLKTMIER
ncbi:inositol hexakisphosphate kinase 2-like [Clavelina lepadiformis]|uniref:inositol hexakisphosphate kinase 2-like n=1 Tax=Clavelina lepadiformis TaxID=159417 RepID=UPI004042FBDC